MTMLDPHEYAERHAKGRSHETRKQRVASTENLIRAILVDALRWAEDRCRVRARSHDCIRDHYFAGACLLDAEEIKTMRKKVERGGSRR